MNNLSICSQNLNSLNTSDRRQQVLKKKIVAIIESRKDIYLVQDVRLNSNQYPNNLTYLNDFLNNNPFAKYDNYINSTRNRRGVGIWVKKN